MHLGEVGTKARGIGRPLRRKTVVVQVPQIADIARHLGVRRLTQPRCRNNSPKESSIPQLKANYDFVAKGELKDDPLEPSQRELTLPTEDDRE